MMLRVLHLCSTLTVFILFSWAKVQSEQMSFQFATEDRVSAVLMSVGSSLRRCEAWTANRRDFDELWLSPPRSEGVASQDVEVVFCLLKYKLKYVSLFLCFSSPDLGPKSIIAANNVWIAVRSVWFKVNSVEVASCADSPVDGHQTTKRYALANCKMYN